jgi:hypothetical protein
MKSFNQFIIDCICFDNEDAEFLEEKNKPTSPEKWARAKAQAKSKFDVYPSAYANAWAAKKYKSMGGGWRSVSEENEENVAEGSLTEMDKSASQPGRDGRVSHSTYGSRDKGGSKEPEKEAKPITSKKAKQDALDILKKQVVAEGEQIDEVAAWQRKEGKNPEGGLNAKGVASYRRENPGSKLQTAVTTKPSKLKPGSKAANRRKSFCARMSGMKKRLTSAKTANDPNSRINKSLRKWNC